MLTEIADHVRSTEIPRRAVIDIHPDDTAGTGFTAAVGGDDFFYNCFSYYSLSFYIFYCYVLENPFTQLLVS
jgi:hypothetical protein